MTITKNFMILIIMMIAIQANAMDKQLDTFDKFFIKCMADCSGLARMKAESSLWSKAATHALEYESQICSQECVGLHLGRIMWMKDNNKSKIEITESSKNLD